MSADPDPEDLDSLDIVPQNPRVLKDIAEMVNRADRKPTKLFCICLYDEEREYFTSFINAGMKATEAVALLETIKLRLLRMVVPPEE